VDAANDADDVQADTAYGKDGQRRLPNLIL